jgi:hypothetical protein
MKIDLQEGVIDAYNFKLTSGNFTLSNEHLSPSSGNMRNWYGLDGTESNPNEKGNIIFKAGDVDNSDRFAITSGGHFYAEAGKIANWNIMGFKLIGDPTASINIGNETSGAQYA